MADVFPPGSLVRIAGPSQLIDEHHFSSRNEYRDRSDLYVGERMLMTKLFADEYLPGVVIAALLWADVDAIVREGASIDYLSRTTAPVNPPIDSTITYVIKPLQSGRVNDPSGVLTESFLTIPVWPLFAKVSLWQ